jgi:hypothetical protein
VHLDKKARGTTSILKKKYFHVLSFLEAPKGMLKKMDIHINMMI